MMGGRTTCGTLFEGCSVREKPLPQPPSPAPSNKEEQHECEHCSQLLLKKQEFLAGAFSLSDSLLPNLFPSFST